MIIPAILEKDWQEIESKIQICRNFTRNLHIDFIDGKFVNNSTFLDIESFKKISSYFDLEAHLMVEEPVNYLDRLEKAGFKTFLGHVEKMSDQVEFVAKGQGLGGVGLCVDLATPITEIKVPFEDLDRLLLLAVPAGNSGQKFDDRVISKIKDLREKTFISIGVDGGINDKELLAVKEAGADVFCVNSFLFGHNAEDNFRLLESLIRK